jgi:hypothetical protein
MYKSGIYQIGAGHKYNLLGFPVGFYTNRGLTDMAEFVSRPLLTVNEYMSGGNTNPLYNIGYGEEEKHIKKMEQLDKDLTKHEALHTKDVEQIKKIIKKYTPMLEGDFNENPMDEDEELHLKQMKQILKALVKHEGVDKKSKTQIKAILKKYKLLKYEPVAKGGRKQIRLDRPKPSNRDNLEKMPYVVDDIAGGKKKRKLKGKGFLSDMFGTIGNVLGTIGKPIFDNVPALKPFSGLLGDNSAYGLASRGLKSIGLGKGKRKGGRKIMMPDHPSYDEIMKGKGSFEGVDMTKPSIEAKRRGRKKDIIF